MTVQFKYKYISRSRNFLKPWKKKTEKIKARQMVINKSLRKVKEDFKRQRENGRSEYKIIIS